MSGCSSDALWAGCTGALVEPSSNASAPDGLQGNPKRWSMRVTGNYRITFGWSGENALDIDFEDYH